MVNLRNRKALSSLWIIVIVATILLASIVAIVAYYYLGNIRTEEMIFDDFTIVEVSRAFELSVKKSNSYSVTISADERIFDDIKVTQTENTLTIGFEPEFDPGDLYRKAEITMPELDKLVLSGASTGTLEGFNTPEPLILEVTGASNLEINDLQVGDIEIKVLGASNLIAQGQGSDLVSIIEGASNLNLTNFPILNCDIVVDGASVATINPSSTLDAQVSGASTLFYIGEPTMGDIEVYGSSTINQK